MRIYQIYLWTSLWHSVCACVCVQHMILALQLPLLWNVCYIKYWAEQCPGHCVPTQLKLWHSHHHLIYALCWLLDCDLLAASHCSRHLFKAHAFKFCCSFPCAQMGRICIKVICLSIPKNGSGYITLQLCRVWEASQIPNKRPRLFERQHEGKMNVNEQTMYIKNMKIAKVSPAWKCTKTGPYCLDKVTQLCRRHFVSRF